MKNDTYLAFILLLNCMLFSMSMLGQGSLFQKKILIRDSLLLLELNEEDRNYLINNKAHEHGRTCDINQATDAICRNRNTIYSKISQANFQKILQKTDSIMPGTYNFYTAPIKDTIYYTHERKLERNERANLNYTKYNFTFVKCQHSKLIPHTCVKKYDVSK